MPEATGRQDEQEDIYLFIYFLHLRNAISSICNEAHSALQFFLVGWKNVQKKKLFKQFLIFWLKSFGVDKNFVRPPSLIGSKNQSYPFSLD